MRDLAKEETKETLTEALQVLSNLAIELLSLIRSHHIVEHKDPDKHSPLSPKLIHQLESLIVTEEHAFTAGELEKLESLRNVIGDRAAASLPGSRKRPFYPTWQGELNKPHLEMLEALNQVGFGTTEVLCALLGLSPSTITRRTQELSTLKIIEVLRGSHPLQNIRYVNIYKLSAMGVSCCRSHSIVDPRYLDVNIATGRHMHRVSVNIIAHCLADFSLIGTCYGIQPLGHRVSTAYYGKKEIFPDVSGHWKGKHTCVEVELENDMATFEHKLWSYIFSEAEQVLVVTVGDKRLGDYIAVVSEVIRKSLRRYDGCLKTFCLTNIVDLVKGYTPYIMTIGEEPPQDEDWEDEDE